MGDSTGSCGSYSTNGFIFIAGLFRGSYASDLFGVVLYSSFVSIGGVTGSYGSYSTNCIHLHSSFVAPTYLTDWKSPRLL